MKKNISVLLFLFCISCNPTPKNDGALDRQTGSEIDNLFAPFNKMDSPGYAIGILKDTSILYEKGYGSANLDYHLPVNIRTAFDIASVSKQFTAAGIALLIMHDSLNLNDPVENYLPELAKYPDTIRIKHLIYNTSGIIDYFRLPRAHDKSWLDFYYFDNDEAIRTSLKPDTLAFHPGDQWDYSNVNYMLLTKIIERVTGEPFPAFMERRLFRPLKMDHTLVNDDITTVIPNRATPYNPRNSEYVRAYRQEEISVRDTGTWMQHHRNAPHFGGSGIVSTIVDLLKWERNFFTKDFGGENFYTLMHRTEKFNHDRDNQAFGLYFGTFRDKTFVAWEGGTSGISSQIIRFPDDKIAIIVLSNMGSGEASQKANELAAILMDHSCF
ncbi:MAG TPA: serine hydrolase domain-containing protein [Saprospiraceae bacterium]|nr:serine hydrolase domain-containing protein [Saprospiraceae bacterium]